MAIKKNTLPAKSISIPKPKKESPEVIMIKESPIGKVTRKDLAQTICNKVHAAGKVVPIKIAEIMVSAYEEAIIEAMIERLEVVLSGFGKFYPSFKEEVIRRNPSTGEKVIVPAHTAVRFKLGSKLKHATTTEQIEGA
jgi:DNA-binding protein HU-beta